MSSFGSNDLIKDYLLIPDTVVESGNNKLIVIYDIRQIAPLGRISKQILLYSTSGEFKDILTLRTFYEDWSDGATHYFYKSYNLIGDSLMVSKVRRNHYISPLINVPRSENVITTFCLFKINKSFEELKNYRHITRTKEIYSFESLEHLKSLDQNELRLVRNYFFAKYNFSFKSEDLRSYFSEKLMYKPEFEDVSMNLTENEKMVIQYIISLEQKY